MHNVIDSIQVFLQVFDCLGRMHRRLCHSNSFIVPAERSNLEGPVFLYLLMKVIHFDSSCFSAKRSPSSCHLDVVMEPLLDPICADESSHEGLELKCQQTTRFFKEMEKAVSLFSLMEALNLSRKWPFKFETMSFLFLCNAIISQNFFLGVHLP